jgi:pyroglutamyl-peptidase
MGTVAADVLLLDRAAGVAVGDDRADTKRQAQVTEFHCTAFGKFHNVAVNPTELLFRSLPAHLAASPLPPYATVASATVLETAAVATRAVLERMHAKVAPLPGRDAAQRPRVVFVHFGVNVGVKRFELELQGYNEATFSCPDEAGWAPVKRPIDPGAPMAHVRRSKLPVQHLAGVLVDAGFDVGVSSDAGRFVCNWVYYNSLRCAARNGSLALFVHVPAAETVPMERQLQFFSALLAAIGRLPPKLTDDA